MWQKRLIREHDNFAADAIRLRDGAILGSGYDGRIRRDQAGAPSGWTRPGSGIRSRMIDLRDAPPG